MHALISTEVASEKKKHDFNTFFVTENSKYRNFFLKLMRFSKYLKIF